VGGGQKALRVCECRLSGLNQLKQVQHAEVENDEYRHADGDGQVFAALEDFLETHLNNSVRVIGCAVA
jgi:hypothetical protein